MKIKQEQMTRQKRKKLRSKLVHWWLEADKPRSKGRLSSMNKQNHKRKANAKKSEFVVRMQEVDSK